MDALQVRPFLVDLEKDFIIIVEGIIDFYLMDLFKGARQFRVLPSVGAKSMKFYISIMIAWRVNYRAVWDNDDEGKGAFDDAVSHFGQREADSRFFLLPLMSSRSKKRIAQDFVDSTDLEKIRNKLSLPANTSFAKTIVTLYFSANSDEIVRSLQERRPRCWVIYSTKLGLWVLLRVSRFLEDASRQNVRLAASLSVSRAKMSR